MQHNYDLSLIYAGDETGVWLDSVSSVSVDVRGSKEVAVRSTGHERMRITVLLMARANGSKLKPLVVLPRIRPIAGLNSDKKISIVYGGKTSWMDEDKCLSFVKTNIGRDIFGRPKLLIWDSFRPHYSNAVKHECKQLGIELAIIPGTIFINLILLN